MTKMKRDFDQARVDEVAAFIAAELRPLLDYTRTDGPISKRVAEACPAYQQGLTLGERVLATLKALNLAALDLVADMTKFKHEIDDEDEELEEAEAEKLAAYLGVEPAGERPPAS